MTSYAVVIERASDGGYGAWCPDLPGCVALADTEDEVLAEMRQKRRRKIDVVPRADPRFWTNPLTCVGTAGFEPATP